MAEERAAGQHCDTGLLASIPEDLPALRQCQMISERAVAVGFEWGSVEDVWAAVESERREFAAESRGSAAAAQEFGDILFALVNVARWEGIDAEEALASSNRKFRRRWAAMEDMACEQGVFLSELSTERQNELWDAAKAQERRIV